MNTLEIKSQYKRVLSSARSSLESAGIPIKEDYESGPYVGSSMINGKEGIYFKIDQRNFLSDAQREIIKEVFPIKIRDGKDLYTWNLLDIADYDWDDDRYWEPSISMELIKNGKTLF